MANAALRARGSLPIWLDKDMVWLAPHDGSPAPDYSTLSRRQQTLTVQIPEPCADGPLNLLVDIEPVNATGSREPARGIKFPGDGEWQVRKHGVQGRRQSLPGRRMRAFAARGRKVHLAMDTATSDIRAVEFTPSRDGDSPVLPDRLVCPIGWSARSAEPDPQG